MTTSEFVKQYNGLKWDFDGAFSSQCVDLMRFYIRDVLGYPQPLAVTGAKDFWFNYSKDTNLKNNFKQIKNTPDGIPQEGDIMIWDKWSGNQYGHVAICLNAQLNSFDSIDQNWDGKLTTQIVKHNYLNPPVLGWLRSNQFMNFIDLKKRLSDVSWSELKEFSELEKLGLIERADSIQTMVMKWLEMVKEMAKLKESDRQKGVKIEMLTESVEGLKTKLVESQAEFTTLIRMYKTEITQKDEQFGDLQEAYNEELGKSSSPLIQIDFTKLINFLKTWQKK